MAHVLRVLWEKLEVAMALTGCRTLTDIQQRTVLTEISA
ncbi:MAG: hypothetical protein QJT81_07150 [Candidatus Thiothrix putei]|uniref:Uncharacterized protein n=1 Tax=Candidatus Thiothrix putei TaxID=3080811 RepID=A0AA95HE41_9GAMM|nr:MAG: hypothetical protein QJT81_07150 [Candidatus Thiothrix putei]